MNPEDIKIGMRLRYGVQLPREVTVTGNALERDGRWFVPVRFITGALEVVPFALLCARPKRPSVRRQEVSLRGVVKAFNEVAPETIAESDVVAALQKHGVG